MQEVKERRQTVVPCFGDWDSCDEREITRYFQSVRQAGLLRDHSFGKEEVDLFRAFPPPSPLLYHYYDHRKPRKQQQQQQQQQRQCRHQVVVGMVKQQGKQARVCDVIGRRPAALAERRGRAPNPKAAVDEDLYKIPPELLYQKPKSRAMLRDLWKRCMSLNCVP